MYQGPYSQKINFSVTYEWTNKLECFVPGRPFQYLFASKARAYPSEATFRFPTLG